MVQPFVIVIVIQGGQRYECNITMKTNTTGGRVRRGEGGGMVTREVSAP